MSKVIDKLYTIMFDRVDLAISGIQTRNFSVDKQSLALTLYYCLSMVLFLQRDYPFNGLSLQYYMSI
jgi:hypothetical protein